VPFTGGLRAHRALVPTPLGECPPGRRGAVLTFRRLANAFSMAAGSVGQYPMPRGRVLIGCSGWNYDHWRDGVFYPPRAQHRWHRSAQDQGGIGIRLRTRVVVGTARRGCDRAVAVRVLRKYGGRERSQRSVLIAGHEFHS
jgi:hypothetical protein